MNNDFRELIEQLDPALKKLVSMTPHKPLDLPPNVPKAGVYVLSDASGHLYVGRTNRMKIRLRNHCHPKATHRMAAFAFRLARAATGNTKPSYRKKGSRADLMSNPAFVEAFEKAKAQIREMDVRFVEETHSTRQCLLEVYVAVALKTPHNDFDNH